MGSPDPNPSSSTSELGDLGQERAPLCACFLRGRDSDKGAGGALSPESHSYLFSKCCLGTYCVLVCPPKGCSPLPLWMRGVLNFTTYCAKKWVVVYKKPGERNQAQRGWAAGPRSHSKSGIQVQLPGPRPAAPVTSQAHSLCCKVGPDRLPYPDLVPIPAWPNLWTRV